MEDKEPVNEFMTVKEPDALDTKDEAEAKVEAEVKPKKARKNKVVELVENVDAALKGEDKVEEKEVKDLGIRVVGAHILVKKTEAPQPKSSIVLPSNNYVQNVEVVQVGDGCEGLSVKEGDKLFLHYGIDEGNSMSYDLDGVKYFVIHPEDVVLVVE